jgi:hypothetical protein
VSFSSGKRHKNLDKWAPYRVCKVKNRLIGDFLRFYARNATNSEAISVIILFKETDMNSDKTAGGAALFKKLLGGKSPEDIAGKAFLAPLLQNIANERDAFLQKDIPLLSWELFRLFDSGGNRLKYEDLYFERRRRLIVLSLASWFWKRPEDITALENCIWAICDEYSWCLPAHMGGSSLLPAESAGNRIRLDLFACETGFALAECCAMLEDCLSPLITDRARSETRRRVILSYVEHREKWNWELMDNNWCAVCAGSVCGAALYLVEDDAFLAEILERLMPVFERYLASFYSDGVCPEGLSYWTYGMSFFVSAGDLLLLRSGGRVDLLSDPALPQIAAFQGRCYFPGGGVLNFSDAACSADGAIADSPGAAELFRPGLSAYLSERFPGTHIPHAPWKAALSGEQGKGLIDHCGRFAPALRDFLWTAMPADASSGDTASSRVIFPEAQWLLCSGAGETGFAAKAGHNGEPHNHNDVGNFIYYIQGKMAICDLGAGEYTRDYFGDKRYEIFCNRSEGHNVPIIGGMGQKAGAGYTAQNCVISGGGEMVFDMAGAYGIPELLKLERRFSFDGPTGLLVLKDNFVFSAQGMNVTERFITAFPLTPKENLVLINAGNESSPRICVLKGPPGTTPLISRTPHRDHEGRDVWIFTIDYCFTPSSGASLSVEFSVYYQ